MDEGRCPGQFGEPQPPQDRAAIRGGVDLQVPVAPLPRQPGTKGDLNLVEAAMTTDEPVLGSVVGPLTSLPDDVMNPGVFVEATPAPKPDRTWCSRYTGSGATSGPGQSSS